MSTNPVSPLTGRQDGLRYRLCRWRAAVGRQECVDRPTQVAHRRLEPSEGRLGARQLSLLLGEASLEPPHQAGPLPSRRRHLPQLLAQLANVAFELQRAAVLPFQQAAEAPRQAALGVVKTVAELRLEPRHVVAVVVVVVLPVDVATKCAVTDAHEGGDGAEARHEQHRRRHVKPDGGSRQRSLRSASYIDILSCAK